MLVQVQMSCLTFLKIQDFRTDVNIYCTFPDKEKRLRADSHAGGHTVDFGHENKKIEKNRIL